MESSKFAPTFFSIEKGKQFKNEFIGNIIKTSLGKSTKTGQFKETETSESDLILSPKSNSISKRFAMEMFASNIVKNENAVTLVIDDQINLSRFYHANLFDQEGITRKSFTFNHHGVLDNPKASGHLSNIATHSPFMEWYLSIEIKGKHNSYDAILDDIFENKKTSIKNKSSAHQILLNASSFSLLKTHGNYKESFNDQLYSHDDIFTPGSISYVQLPILKAHERKSGSNDHLLEFYIEAWSYFASIKDLPLQICILSTDGMSSKSAIYLSNHFQTSPDTYIINASSSDFEGTDIKKVLKPKNTYLSQFLKPETKKHCTLWEVEKESAKGKEMVVEEIPHVANKKVCEIIISHKDKTGISDYS